MQMGAALPLRRAGVLGPRQALDAFSRANVKKRWLRGSFEIIPKEWLWSDEPAKLTEDPATGWTQKSVRTGVIAQKLGMVHAWDKWHRFQPLTVLQIPSCVVIQHKTEAKNGINAVQVAAGSIKTKNVKKPQLMEFEKAGVEPRRKLAEFPVTENAFVPVGTEIVASHFTPGQLLDVQGKTKGKGFQGVMKKWNFGGGRASHGVSKAHRQMGSTGACQDPGKVFKGKKMPGRMGGYNRTTKNVQLYAINTQKNLLYVKGNVAGGQNGWVRVIDAKNKRHEVAPPFPTYLPKEGLELEEEIVMEMEDKPELQDEIVDLAAEKAVRSEAGAIKAAEREVKKEEDKKKKKLEGKQKRKEKRKKVSEFEELDSFHIDSLKTDK